MADFVEREKILALQTELHFDSIEQLKNWKCRHIDPTDVELLPAADVRPVVLCRECVHWERYNNTAGCGYCHKVKFEYGADGYVFNPVREPDFYCADGEKRQEAPDA